jgi:phenylalanyl-tRNA synthetase alpha chain
MEDGDQQLADIESQARTAIAAAASFAELDQIKAPFVGRKGEVQGLFRLIPTLDPSERGSFGKRINALKQAIEGFVEARGDELRGAARDDELADNAVDVTLPGRAQPICPPHPLTATLLEIEAVFSAMGFSVAEGPEVEWEALNFDALNFPPNHPARDMQDTFFVQPEGDAAKQVLRTHTSPVQVRTMLQHDPPIRVICPGRVYRSETQDASHSAVFHQVEGLMVGEGVSFAELKGVLQHVVRELFGTDELRFRPSFFPFTEPSAEVDMRWTAPDGRRRWLEIMGCGMVDPAVFRSVGYPEGVTGWAFGMGVERMAMLRHGVDDIRHFFSGDLRFLRQFAGADAR